MYNSKYKREVTVGGRNAAQMSRHQLEDGKELLRDGIYKQILQEIRATFLQTADRWRKRSKWR